MGYYDSTADRVVIFGGSDEGIPGRDIWVLDLSSLGTWRKVPIAGGPTFSGNTVLVVDPIRGRFYAVNPSGPNNALVDLWMLDVVGTPHWVRLATASGTAPTLGLGLSATFDTRRQRILITGDLAPAAWALDVSGSPVWKQLVPAGAAGPALAWPVSAYDPVGDRVLTYGGDKQVAPHILAGTDQTWELDFADSVSWSTVVATGDSIGVRYDAQLAFDPVGNNVLLLGGEDNSTARNTASVFRLSLGPGPVCTRLSPAGFMSRPRLSATVVFDSRRDRFLLFGGWTGPDNSMDVDQLSLRPSPAWTPLVGVPLPAGRFGHAMAVDPVGDRVFIFGGVSPLGYLSDPWVAPLEHPEQWTPVVTQDSAPPPRHEPVAIYDSVHNRLVTFGGWTYPENYFNDTWILSFAGSPAWTQARPSGSLPPGRRADAAVYDPLRNRMLVFGGMDKSGGLTDVWALDLAGTMQWSELHPAGEGPGKRFFASAIYDPTRDRVLVYGGDDTTYRSLGDTWALTLSDCRWEALPADGAGPSLTRHTAVYDMNNDRMLVFGGWDAVDPDFLISWEDATFSLDFSPSPHWSWWTSPTGYPPTRSAHTAAYDPARGRMLIFGGGGFNDYWNDSWLLEFGPSESHQAWLLGSQVETSSLTLTWFLAQGPRTPAVVERSSIGEGWHTVGAIRGDSSSRALFSDAGLQPGWRYSYRVRATAPGTPLISAEYAVLTTGSPTLRWLGAWPNPARRSGLAIQFVVSSIQPVDFGLYDLEGRAAAIEHITPKNVGLLTVRPTGEFKPGIYFARLTQGGHAVGGKVCIIQ